MGVPGIGSRMSAEKGLELAVGWVQFDRPHCTLNSPLPSTKQVSAILTDFKHGNFMPTKLSTKYYSCRALHKFCRFSPFSSGGLRSERYGKSRCARFSAFPLLLKDPLYRRPRVFDPYGVATAVGEVVRCFLSLTHPLKVRLVGESRFAD